MTRISQFVWPMLAMLASFVAVFALTWVFSVPPPSAPETNQTSSLPTPTPTPTPEAQESAGLVLVARGVRSTGNAALIWEVSNVLQFPAGLVCLAPALTADGWQPVDDTSWSAGPDGRWCRQIAPNQTVDLKFVK